MKRQSAEFDPIFGVHNGSKFSKNEMIKTDGSPGGSIEQNSKQQNQSQCNGKSLMAEDQSPNFLIEDELVK